jgi:transposase-like protein
MQYYSEEFKKTAIAKMAVPGGWSAISLSREIGISQSTLSRWLREGATVGLNGGDLEQRRPEDWSAEEKLDALLGYTGPTPIP